MIKVITQLCYKTFEENISLPKTQGINKKTECSFCQKILLHLYSVFTSTGAFIWCDVVYNCLSGGKVRQLCQWYK